MKKLLAMLLVAVMSFSLVACGGEASEESKESTNESTEQTITNNVIEATDDEMEKVKSLVDGSYGELNSSNQQGFGVYGEVKLDKVEFVADDTGKNLECSISISNINYGMNQGAMDLVDGFAFFYVNKEAYMPSECKILDTDYNVIENKTSVDTDETIIMKWIVPVTEEVTSGDFWINFEELSECIFKIEVE